jgi:predicted MPP superfamily phosphohydrolase
VKLRRLIGDFVRKRNPLDIEHIVIPIEKISPSFTSLRIAHISDTHIPRTAFSPCEIADAIGKQTPDIILFTGDMMDINRKFEGPKISLLISLLMKIAPVFVISGNHERKNGKYYKIWRTMLKLRGVHFMNNHVTRFEKEGVTFVITGMKDINMLSVLEHDFSFLSEIEVADDECYLWLHHKPNIWRSYYPADAPTPDVVFSGHAHGGQVRIPFIKRGLLAPDQGFFPKYTSGLYHYPDGSYEVVSRGVASATKPVRVNNHPHIPVVEIVPKG